MNIFESAVKLAKVAVSRFSPDPHSGDYATYAEAMAACPSIWTENSIGAAHYAKQYADGLELLSRNKVDPVFFKTRIVPEMAALSLIGLNKNILDWGGRMDSPTTY